MDPEFRQLDENGEQTGEPVDIQALIDALAKIIAKAAQSKRSRSEGQSPAA